MSGTEELTKALSVFGELAKEMLGKALYREAEYIMSDAKQLCPVDTGNLRASGHVTQPEVTGESVSVVLGFGGPAVKYALPVHERLDVHHPNGQAKYLEQPMLAAAKNLESRLASYMRGK